MALNAGQIQAQKWFETLETLSEDEAIAMMVDGNVIPCTHGTIQNRMFRSHAIELIRRGARKAPEKQAGLLHHFMVVAINDDGFQVQLRTKPSAENTDISSIQSTK